MNFDTGYASARSPVMARNVVAASQPLATQAGIEALRKGGNAVDAAIATAITLTVVEPNSNGIGGDAFAQIWDGKRLLGLNASGRAPMGWSTNRFQRWGKMPSFGWDSVTVPGAVSAWVALSERYGRLPFEDLFEAPIRYAHDGFPVSPIVARAWAEAAGTYADFKDFAAHFLPAPSPGRLFRRPDQARTLAQIAASRGEAFYHGAIAEQIVAAARLAGGVMNREDLAQHHADWVTPIEQRYRDVVLHELPPNGQGIAALIALGILQHRPMPPVDSDAAIHLQIEAMKIANHTAATHVADADAMQVAQDALLDEARLANLAAGIGPMAAQLSPAQVLDNPGTVYLCAADADGLMVSFIQSNYMGFGSGIVIPGTGIAMQNRGRGFNLIPGHPNCVGPGKRPFHTIIPGFVTANGEPKLAFGVMGGHMQHQGHVQMMHRLFDAGQNPQTASDAPRWIVNPDFSVGLESSFEPDLLERLRARGHRVAIQPDSAVFGGAQLIYRNGDSYIAGSDHRKDGQAIGF